MAISAFPSRSKSPATIPFGQPLANGKKQFLFSSKCPLPSFRKTVTPTVSSVRFAVTKSISPSLS